MSLRASVVAIIACTTLVLAALAHIISGGLIRGSFAGLEEHTVQENVQRVLSAMQDDITKLDRFVLDWASWDDTYRFIVDRNPAYEESNLLDGTFRDQKLSLIAYFDAQGRMAWGRCFDLKADAQVPFFSGLLPQLTPSAPLLHHQREDSSKAGVIMLDQGPMYVASRPILTSDGQGPIRGALVMGRLLDNTVLAALAARTRLALRLTSLRSGQFSPRELEAVSRLKDSPEPLVMPRDQDLTEGYILLPDVSGRPAQLLTVRMPRDIFAAGQRTALHNLVTTLAVCLVLGLAMVLLLERLVVWPISSLGREVNRIGSQRAFAERVAAPGQAELDMLAGRINAMLGELEDSQRSLEARVEERTRELTLSNLSLQAEVAERLRVEKSLEQAKDQAVAADRAKSEFLANMSHEIRTPLNVILGNVDVIRDSGVPGLYRGWLDNVRHAALTLQAVVEDVLDLSKIEAGKLNVRPEPFDLHDLLKRTLRLFEAQAEGKGLELALDIDPDLPRQVVGAADRLGQVLRNLLGNALKFTNQGGVAMQARIVPDFPGGLGMEIQVQDSGIGIAAADMGRLFAKFGQIDRSYAKQHSGTGLGLAISKRLVELMGGGIRVESVPGRGSVFSFRVPLALPAPEAAAPPGAGLADNPGLPPLDILLAEGSPSEREFLCHVLEEAGHRVAGTAGGSVAREALGRKRFDLVLLDIQALAGEGREILREIRAAKAGATGPDVPVVALAAYRFGNGQDGVPEADADGFLSKPVEVDGLFRTMARVLGTRERDRKVADSPTLDRDALRRRFAGKEQLLSRLSALVAVDLPDRLAALGRALDGQDLAAARDLARRLAGPLSLLPAGRARGLAGELARAAEAGDLSRARALLRRLEHEAAALLDLLADSSPASPA